MPRETEHYIGPAYDTGSEIIISPTLAVFATLKDHNCDAMGCGQMHVMYRFKKPAAVLAAGKGKT